MANKFVKLFLIIALVVIVAFGVSFLPFSLADKFKEVAEKLTSKIKGLSQMGNYGIEKIQLDFAKKDTYKFGKLNVVMEKTDNVPKEGFHKLIHKLENDIPFDVEKFLIGDIEINGLESGLIDYAAGYFKADLPHLLLIELKIHQKDAVGIPEGNATNMNAIPAGNGHVPAIACINTNNGAAGSAAANGASAIAGQAPATSTTSNIIFYAPGENNNWIKLPENANLAEKAEEILAKFIAADTAAIVGGSHIDVALNDPNIATLAAQVALKSSSTSNLRGVSTPIIDGAEEPAPAQDPINNAGIPGTPISTPSIIPGNPEISAPAPTGNGISQPIGKFSTPIIGEDIANTEATESAGINTIGGSSIAGGINIPKTTTIGTGGIAGGNIAS